ncbi:MAG: AsmA-like C-terminal region-containing protein [Fuerstiella sp.]|nr:AsmA-like C-terminal region-containing protein [Fuerstiella sp.]MCP4859217.1 AsmA-like C-terminal region-containing protein [Fuerstiella sp.]
MKIVPVLKWMVRLTLLTAIVGGGAALYFWNQRDRLVHDEILKRFNEAAPELKLSVGATRLDGADGATLTDVEIRDRQSGQPLFRANEISVDIDANRLLEQQQVSVNAVHMDSVDVLLIREEDGRWNWQQYEFHPRKNSPIQLPQISLKNIRVQLTLKHGGGIPEARVLLTSSAIQALPASQNKYDFDGGINLPGVGLLNVAGAWDLTTRNWNLGGQLKGVQANKSLMGLAQATNPDIQDHLTQVESVLGRVLPQPPSGLVSTPRPSGAALLIGNDGRTAPQFVGVLDVDFSVNGSPDLAVPAFKLKIEVRDGRLVSPVFPIVLTEVQATFFKDNQNLEFRLTRAKSGEARLSGWLQMQQGAGSPAGRARFDVTTFRVDRKLQPLMPPRVQRLFDAFQPDALVSGGCDLRQQPDGRWRPENFEATIDSGTATYHRFRYPVDGLTGTLKQRPFINSPENGFDLAHGYEPAMTERDVMLDVTIAGRLGTQPFASTGWWKNPGPAAEMLFEMSVDDFPLDSRFRDAVEDNQRAVIDSLNLVGMASADLVFYRPPGLDRPTHSFMNAHVFDAKMRFAKFPYDIENLSGTVTFNGRTKHWQFSDLQGQHENGRIQATGSFQGLPAPGVLDLTITARNAALDADLYNALNKPQRDLWNMIEPDGFCDLTAQVHWTASPGQTAIVVFPAHAPVRIFNTRIRPKPFPLEMLVREATLSFDPNDEKFAGVQHCEIHSFQAFHNKTPIRATGWADAKPDGEWQVHLNDLTAVNLKPDDQLRAAMPTSWRETLNRLHQQGSVSIENSEMDFRGVMAGNYNPTARWDLNMRFRDCAVQAGLDVTGIYGLVTAQGAWDGFHLHNTGTIQLDTAEVLEMPFTHVEGPYSVNDVELVLGARKVFVDRDLTQVDRRQRIKAKAYGGDLVLDALVDLRKDGQYRFFTELDDALLEEYAALHIPDQKTLKGVIKAWMFLEGTGDSAADVEGEGQLQISPASLYELPVMVHLMGALSQLKFNVQDRTAFDYARMDFNVGREAFNCKRIDLVGKSISLLGRGTVGFAGDVHLDFFSRPPRPTAASLPIINRLWTQWTMVEVRGTTSRPLTTPKPLGQLDQNMQQFLKAFNPTPGGPTPLLVVPRAFPQGNPLLRRTRQQSAADQQRKE